MTYIVWIPSNHTGVYTNVLEVAECIGEIKSSVPVIGCNCPFPLEVTEMVSSNGCFSLASEPFIGIGKSTESYTGNEWPNFTEPY